jgi:hypothetical protein
MKAAKIHEKIMGKAAASPRISPMVGNFIDLDSAFCDDYDRNHLRPMKNDTTSTARLNYES